MLLMQNYYTDKSILGHVIDQSTCIVRKGYGHYIMRYTIYLETFFLIEMHNQFLVKQRSFVKSGFAYLQ